MTNDREIGERRHRFELAADTRLLYSLLQKAAIGETVTFAAMSAQLSRTVGGADCYLQSALRIIERDEEIVFGSVRGVGYKRLSDAEIATTIGPAAITRMRRAATRATRSVLTARDEKLTNEERVKRNTTLSFLGMIRHATKPAAVERIESEVRNASRELPIGRTLEALKK